MRRTIRTRLMGVVRSGLVVVFVFGLGGRAHAYETPVAYATACQNVLAAGNTYWYDAPHQFFFVSDDYLASYRVPYSSGTAFVSAANSFFGLVASVTGTTYSRDATSGVLTGTFKNITVRVLSVSGSSCAMEPLRDARHMQPFLTQAGQITVAGVTYSVPLQYTGDDSGSGLATLEAEASESFPLDEALAEEESICEEAAVEAELAAGGGPSPTLATIYECGRGGGGGDRVNYCQACATATSHRRAARIEAYGTQTGCNIFDVCLWQEHGSEVQYRRKTSANCSSSGSWEDWCVSDSNNAWNYSCFVDGFSTSDDYDRNGDCQNDVFGTCLWCFRDSFYNGANAHGKSRSWDGVWFETNMGVACKNMSCDIATDCDF